MNTRSFWEEQTGKERQQFPQLEGDIEAEVAIIGGGITGITAAHELVQKGIDVVVLEKGHLAGGTTGFSTGNLYTVTESWFHKVEDKFNFEAAKAVAWGRRNAIDYVEQNVKQYGLDCHFKRRPWYAFATDEKKVELLEKEVNFLQRAEVPVEWLDELPLKADWKKAAMVPDDARFNPLEYVNGLAGRIKGACRIYEHSEVLEWEALDEGCELRTRSGKVKAAKTIMATHTPKGFDHSQMNLYPYRSYVVSAKVAAEPFPVGNFWHLDKPFRTFSTHAWTGNDPDLMMVAGGHHKVGQADDEQNKYQALEEFLRDHYQVEEMEFRWSAQHYKTADRLPYIGKSHHDPDRIWIATGFTTDGLTYGSMAGQLLAAAVTGGNNELLEILDPHRNKLLAGAPRFLKENLNIVGQYMKELPGTMDVKDPKEIPVGEGRTYEQNGDRLAVFRKAEDDFQCVSAICTHMDCPVQWNNAEKTWDCPCHGSRFWTDGNVIEGPAYKPLEKRKLK